MDITVKGLSVNYKGGGGLKKVSSFFESGSITAFIGPNGGGKSTFLSCIGGALPHEGNIYIGDKLLNSYSRREMGTTVSMVEQSINMIYPFSVFEVIAMGRLPYGREDSDELIKRVRNAASIMDLDRYLSCSVTELSGGERQRVAIAQSIVQDCPVMLLDEPTSALDPGHSAAFFEYLASMASSGKTIVLSVHDINLASLFSNKLICLKNGYIVSQGKPSHIMNEKSLEEVYGVKFKNYVGKGGQTLWFFE